MQVSIKGTTCISPVFRLSSIESAGEWRGQHSTQLSNHPLFPESLMMPRPLHNVDIMRRQNAERGSSTRRNDGGDDDRTSGRARLVSPSEDPQDFLSIAIEVHEGEEVVAGPVALFGRRTGREVGEDRVGEVSVDGGGEVREVG